MRNPPPNYVECNQHDPSWWEARIGHCTASRIGDAIWTLKNGASSAAREKYKMELLTELITGRPTEHYVSPAMDFGVENEPLARSVYEMRYGLEVERVGFFRNPRIPRSGASPDGLVGDDGLVEIKVPNVTTHLEYWLAEVPPPEYVPQMTWQLACTGRKYCDFVSFRPDLPDDFNLFVVRLDRDEEAIKTMEKQVAQFISELNALAEKLLKGKDYLTDQLERSVAPGPPRAEIPTEL